MAERLEADAEAEHVRKAEAAKAAERAAADTEEERLRAAEARRRIAVMEAKGGHGRRLGRADPPRDQGPPGRPPHRRGRRERAERRRRLPQGHRGGRGRRPDHGGLLAGGYDPMAAYVPQSWR